jgi:lipid-A-disaccharide synthase
MTGPFLIVAGEKSGENYGAAVVRRFHETNPDARFFGVGGTNMAEAGVEIVQPMSALAVVGLAEVISKLPRIRRIFDGIRSEVAARKPAAALLIDSPDFNLRLAKRLKKLGVPVLYYISPTVWAWRKGRLKTVRDAVRKMCLIFPFEEALYAKADIPARFVGHPLLERVRTSFGREEFFRKYGLDPARKLIVLLPGSRKSEIGFHMPVLAAALDRIREHIACQFVLVQAQDMEPGLLEAALPDKAPDLKILREDAYEAMAAADLALSACGTANLEAALLGTPLVAFYRVSPLTYAAGRRFVRIDDYSIVNILAGHRIVPELIQGGFTAEAVARESIRLLDSDRACAEQRARFLEIRERLGRESASRNVADELAALAGSSGSGS